MFRVWDVSLMICFSLSLMFVGGEVESELPPPRNLTFTWETPFELHMTWEKPKDLEPDCKVNYTVHLHHSQDCSERDKNMSRAKVSRRVTKLSCKLNISNENGLCISVTVNPVNCGIKQQSQPLEISIPPPSVRLVKNMKFEYSHNRMKCTWKSDIYVPDLGFYYWSDQNETVVKCNQMKTGECIIHNTFLKDMKKMFYLFNGTYNGQPVNKTFITEGPQYFVKLDKPKLTIQRVGHELHFQTHGSLLEFQPYCYKYNFTYSKCNEHIIKVQKDDETHKVEYDSNCKYRARVQIIFSDKCGDGVKSDPSDEVEYGEDRDPNLPALLALIIIPLIVSCCLIFCLVLLRRHKDIIFPKIPEPTLIFKDMLINNIRMAEDLRSTADGRLYIPFEEIVESKISLEPETPLLPTATDMTFKKV